MGPVELQPADLVFVRGKRWIDVPIKLVTRSQYTHVAGYVGHSQLVEAQGLRTTGYIKLDAYKGQSDVFRCPKLTERQKHALISFVLKEIGGRYDYLLIGWEAVRLTLGIVVPYLRSNRRICSTLWADAYKSVGVNLSPDHLYPTPADLTMSKHLRKIGCY